MKVIHIDKKQWFQGIDTAREHYHLLGPVAENNISIFKSLYRDIYPEMSGRNTTLSPKSILFPQTEKILTACLDESVDNHHIMQRATADYSPRAVIGIQPCDARAVQLMKVNFDTADYRDPYWCDAYDATTFVGLAVNRPVASDFSTSMGTGPFAEEGLDVLLVDTGEHYLAKVVTPKGENFLAMAGFDTITDTAAALNVIESMKKEAEAAITTKVDTDSLAGKDLLALHAAPFWEDIAFTCINCGTCTFLCPTCWCFDIQDETRDRTAARFRNWDTCMAPLFTQHGSGHNPRADKTQRVRQRFMHKFKYFVDKYDHGTMCVGCGRCVEKCPVNIDIRTVCNTMNAYEPQKQSA